MIGQDLDLDTVPGCQVEIVIGKPQCRVIALSQLQVHVVGEIRCGKGARVVRIITSNIVCGLWQGAVDGSHIEKVSRVNQHACGVVEY
jgi:hypothetical protein